MLALTFDPTIDLGRSGARHGYGCFETVRVQAGAPRWHRHHLARLAAGCAFLGLDAPPPEDALAEALGPHLAPLARFARGVLHLVAVDGSLVATFGEAPPPPAAPARIAVAEAVTRFSRSPAARFKTLAYLENRLLQR